MITSRICQEYRAVVHMLTHRGTRAFAETSERLDGSASDSFHAGDPNLADLGHMMSDILDNLSHESIFGQKEEPLDARQAVDVLSARLRAYFDDPAAWLCFANFLNRLSLKRIEEDYAGLF